MNESEELLERLRVLADRARAVPGLLGRMAEILGEARSKQAAAEVSRSDGPAWHGMIGLSKPILELRRRIEKFAVAAAPVLIAGESGTGKELVASALHQLSPRSRMPFITENCAAIPETLLESVLFGHVRGAFTGAVRDHAGHFVSAHGGSLLLDEIGDMPLSMQVKMLRVLQEGEVRPVGGERMRRVDVRVIAATNQDLAARVKSGQFREDLYYRLNALQLVLPPLRERGDDVLLLARHFLAQADRPLELEESAAHALLAAPWPGNVRQLQNEMQRLATLCEGPRIRAEDL